MTSLPEQEAVAVAGSWLEAAEEDLDAVERLLREDSFVPRRVCVLANAAARKALTALLSVGRTPFSRRHDLDALLRMLPLHSLVRREVADLKDLAQWAAEPRFPGDWQEATVEDSSPRCASSWRRPTLPTVKPTITPETILRTQCGGPGRPARCASRRAIIFAVGRTWMRSSCVRRPKCPNRRISSASGLMHQEILLDRGT